MESLFIYGSLAIQILGGTYFHKVQNQPNRIGGKISAPKTIWLFFALYLYFILPVICYLVMHSRLKPDVSTSLFLFLILIYCRALFQPVFMYLLKIWSPANGITYNLFCFFLLASRFIAHTFKVNVMSVYDVQVLILIGIVMAALITDSFYAWFFYRIVGKNTQGDNAIWYASDINPAFVAINRATALLNIFFIGSLFYWILKMPPL